ncbi:hypothetical protein MPSEU_000790200 [Mayamaea pseudoterrestris]|nr:hypothetical protein MPSEU_000790200 [Mayamaea pseudoterrestris]
MDLLVKMGNLQSTPQRQCEKSNLDQEGQPKVPADRRLGEMIVSRALCRRVDEILDWNGFSTPLELEEPDPTYPSPRAFFRTIKKTEMLQGIFAGSVALGCARRFRAAEINGAMIKANGSVGGSRFFNGGNTLLHSHTTTNPGNVKLRLDSLSLNASGWFVDVTASMFVAVVTSAIIADCDERSVTGREEFVKTPLVEGAPPLLTAVCPKIVLHYQNLHRLFPYVMEDPVTDELMAWKTFTANCQHRMRQEKKIRLSMGLDADAKVSIPSPGVLIEGDDSVLWVDEESEDADKADESTGVDGDDVYSRTFKSEYSVKMAQEELSKPCEADSDDMDTDDKNEQLDVAMEVLETDKTVLSSANDESSESETSPNN